MTQTKEQKKKPQGKMTNLNRNDESVSADPKNAFPDTQFVVPPGLNTHIMDFEAHYGVSDKEPILILGATGVGKSLFLHLSKELFKKEHEKAKKPPPIIQENCAHFAGGVSDLNMTRSELFGHVKGSHSVATKDKEGLVEEADGGLLILEEIGELPLEAQAMLLTFIETGEYRRVGDTKTRRANTKIVGATNRESELRDDFRYRFFPFYIPPLHERRRDILYYFYQIFPQLTKNLTKSEVLLLLGHNWPGNVRELERVGRLLMREKWIDGSLLSADPSTIPRERSNRIYHLDGKDTSFNPEILEQIGLELPGWDIDVELLEKLLNRGRISLLENDSDYSFRELQKDNSDYFAWTDQFNLRFCNEFTPFEEAYSGYLAFCGLFLQDPLKDDNVLTTLKDCDFYHFNYDNLVFSKSDEEPVNRLAKAIMKYLKQIYVEDYKWPSNIIDYWNALEDISETYYRKNSNMDKDGKGQEFGKIWSMNEKDLLSTYYKGLLQRTGGSIKLAAEKAGHKPTTFRARLEKHGVHFKKADRIQES